MNHEKDINKYKIIFILITFIFVTSLTVLLISYNSRFLNRYKTNNSIISSAYVIQRTTPDIYLIFVNSTQKYENLKTKKRLYLQEYIYVYSNNNDGFWHYLHRNLTFYNDKRYSFSRNNFNCSLLEQRRIRCNEW